MAIGVTCTNMIVMALNVQKATALPAARIGVGMISEGYVYPALMIFISETEQIKTLRIKKERNTECVHDEGISNKVNKHEANSKATEKQIGIA
jgi:hypothetical protein